MKKSFLSIATVLSINIFLTTAWAIEVIDSQEDLYESIHSEKKNPFAQANASFSHGSDKVPASKLSAIEKMNMEGKAIMIKDSHDAASEEIPTSEDERLTGTNADGLSEREDFVQEYDEDDSFEDRIEKSMV